MGQVVTKCNSNNHSQNNFFLERQEKIFRWRADPYSNTFIPRIHLTTQTELQSKTLYEKHLHNPHKNYLEFDQIKKTIQNLPQKSNKIIMFENYPFRLEDFKNSLKLNQLIYAISSLLSGYEQITKMYHQISIHIRNCFVTENGQIRVWINRNYKANCVEGNVAQWGKFAMLGEVLKIGWFLGGQPQAKRFMGELESYVNKLRAFRQPDQELNALSNVRHFINQFVYISRLSIPLNLEKQMQRRTTSSQEQDINKAFFKHKKVLEEDQSRKSTPLTRSKNPSFIKKSQILQTAESQNFNLMKKTPMLRSRNTSQRSSKKTSYLLTQPNVCVEKFPNYQSKDLYRNTLSALNKVKSVEKFVSQKGNDKRISINVQESIPTSNQVNKTENKTKNILKTSILKGSQRLPQKERQNSKVSIFNNVEILNRQSNTSTELKLNQPLRSVKQKNTYNFQNQDQQSFCSSNSGGSDFYNSRPWITTKTISRLLSADQQNSMKQSIDDGNSECGSIYSGLLTNFGREVPKDQIKKCTESEFF